MRPAPDGERAALRFSSSPQSSNIFPVIPKKKAMEKFDLNARLAPVYSADTEYTPRPVIGITANYTDGDASVRDRYYRQVVAAGGTPLIIPPVADTDVIGTTLDTIDGLLLTGGGDYNPLWAGEQPSPQLHAVNAERDLPELLVTRLAYNRQLPILGICRGMQTLAMALGGHVEQDIAGRDRLVKHSQDADRSEPTHTVDIREDSLLHTICHTSRMAVNSFHHQAVDNPGSRFAVAATAPDGVIEAMESTEYKSIIGVQWHPEWLGEDGLPLFRWLVAEARTMAAARRIHRRVLTLDSHCDTPMFFPEGIDFSRRDARILVDLHKMTDGMQDAVTMAAYLPQPQPGQDFADVAPYPVDGPRAYADLIIDKIEDLAAAHPDRIALARTPDDLYRNKRDGLKSIMVGIENGLALEDDLANVAHFARRGVVYVTLCHNGDNDICDSARRSLCTHGGVSAYGETVIREMNRLGVMVDLSHAGEKSFYDAIDISTQPVVCSHSNSRALCDVPRNLTDDQLRAIARAGGVVQTTLYLGFLRTEGEASIVDAIDHLEHAIHIMGIDHVGLGTDFDGDGGVCGIADSSELINFTKRLLGKYSEEDIAKIWGGNWLRVMRQVQAERQRLSAAMG